MGRELPESTTTPHPMLRKFTRRRLLNFAAAGLSAIAMPGSARAQLATQAPPKRATPDEFSVAAPVAIEVNARPIPAFDPRDPQRLRFGALEYRSGLVLTSRFPGFGGLSAWRWLDAKGERFIAVSDHGSWFSGRILYRGGAMTGLDDVEAAPLLGPDGRPITARGWFDSEAIALDGNLAYVALERVNQVLRYDFSKGFTRARGEVVPLPPAARKLPYNKGLEALVMVPKGLPLAGTLIAISERGLDTAGNLSAFLIGGSTPGAFAIKRGSRYDVTDAALLPGGNMLLLERRFGWDTGLAVRIRRIALGEIKPGALADGAVLFEADLGYEIDNMEGLSVHRAAGGEIVLTLVSDDNFSVIQRTLLLQFTLAEP